MTPNVNSALGTLLGKIFGSGFSIILWIALIICALLISCCITLGIIRLLLFFPPLRHLAQSIFQVISGRD